MTNFRFSNTRPEHWDQQCSNARSLFHSGDWQALLAECFRGESIFAWHPQRGCGAAIAVFPAGPFRIAYLGFPLGGSIGRVLDEPGLRADLFDGLANDGSAGRPVCLRIPSSAFAGASELALPYASTPETAIVDLHDWSHQAVSKNIRRNLKKAAGAGLAIDDTHDSEDGARLFDIYFNTVKRHGGSLRYNAHYFSRLIELSRTRDDIRVSVTRKNREIAGFIVVATEADTACYLHGGTNFALGDHHSSALLFNAAIESAKSAGLRCFNFMSSPPGQASLVQYKEKWGGITREHKTHVLALRPGYRWFKLAEKLYSLVR